MDFCDKNAFCAMLMQTVNDPGQLLPRLNARMVSLSCDGRAQGELPPGRRTGTPGALSTAGLWPPWRTRWREPAPWPPRAACA